MNDITYGVGVGCAMNRLADEQVDFLQSAIATLIVPNIMERGWDYYRKRKVMVTEVVEGNAVYGAVSGESVYGVMLDADDFAYSTCTCPYKGYCKHMAAVFFHYYETTGGNPDAWYMEYSGKKMPAGLKGNAVLEAAASKIEDAPDQESGPSAWRDYFQKDYGEIWRHCRHSLHPLQPVLQELKGKSKLWSEPLRRVHWLHVITFVLEQVELAYASTDAYNRYYYEMSFSRSVDPWIAHFNELVTELKPVEMTVEEREWIDSLNNLLRRNALNASFTLLRWDYMLHVLWKHLAGNPELAAAERVSLDKLLADKGWDERQRSVLQAAKAQLSYRDGDDVGAIKLLEDTPFERTSLFIYEFAEQRLKARHKEGLIRWLDFIGSKLADCRNSTMLRPFMRLCREADQSWPDSGRWLDMMTQHLPYSYAELSSHLLERGKYEEWADLQLLLTVRPDELDVQDIREVAKSAPSTLLPLYHQAVDDSIQTRNRQGYKTAVKLLKRLEKLYNSSDRSHVWKRYITYLHTKHSRLRALQEELKKGKLVP
ncbi:SWIM zinc finger family protein [Paenibacillus tarimensis]|uniref:SWIM zinc finger family protein n=1 Tax=Paenibacillus tarimensis TaxID=416012 RepID=UPI001F1F0644|nr:SWIM zinc finger family protein [Paenibacillus tarimensis]MCF2943056.1 SWIM zinc finger domain-containing protein [Paenibacillus tarimensis]